MESFSDPQRPEWSALSPEEKTQIIEQACIQIEKGHIHHWQQLLKTMPVLAAPEVMGEILLLDTGERSLLTCAQQKNNQLLLDDIYKTVRPVLEVDKTDQTGINALYLAIVCRQSQEVIQALSGGENPLIDGSTTFEILQPNPHNYLIKNSKKFIPVKETPLIVAAQSGHVELVNILIQASVRYSAYDPKTTDTYLNEGENGKTALYFAIFYNYPHIVKMLIEAGAIITKNIYPVETSSSHCLPIHLAAIINRETEIKLLIETLPNALVQCDHVRMLDETPTNAMFEDAKEIIIKSVQQSVQQKKTRALKACWLQNNTVMYIIFPINNKIREALSRMKMGAKSKDQNFIQTIQLAYSQYILDLKDVYNRTPFILAHRHNHPGIVKYLMSKGADISSLSELLVGQPKTQAVEKIEYYHAALEHFEKKSYQTVISILTILINVGDHSAKNYSLRGTAWYYDGLHHHENAIQHHGKKDCPQFTNACRDFVQALKIDPQHGLTHDRFQAFLQCDRLFSGNENGDLDPIAKDDIFEAIQKFPIDYQLPLLLPCVWWQKTPMLSTAPIALIQRFWKPEAEAWLPEKIRACSLEHGTVRKIYNHLKKLKKAGHLGIDLPELNSITNLSILKKKPHQNPKQDESDEEEIKDKSAFSMKIMKPGNK